MDAKELGRQPAHPDRRLVQDRYDTYSLESEGGLSKRELFAAMAMQGLCASFEGHRMTVQAIAPLSVKAADALLAELAKAGDQ